MDTVMTFLRDYLSRLDLSQIKINDIIEILILAFLLYHIIKWVKQTRAWWLVRGLGLLLFFWIIAAVFQFNAILWIFVKTISVGIIALIIVFQPEFRKALEQLGRKNIIQSFTFGETKDKEERFSERTITELVRAVYEFARMKTGALIVIEQEVVLTEYEQTGITIDAIVSSQLLINIFEHNTPLHDGAIIIRGDRITSATCYLPLSDNMSLSKELGTRHRAGVGISEVTDSFTIIVSEQTGKVSIAQGGELIRGVDSDYLRAKLAEVRKKSVFDTKVRKIKLWKGKQRNERGIH